MGIRNQKVGNVLILMSFRNGLPRRPVGPPRNDRLFRQTEEETHQMRLLLFMFVTHNLGYSLNDFISIIIGKLNSSVIRRTHSSVSAPTSLITICV